MYMDIQMPWLLRPTWMWEGRVMQEQLPRCKRAVHSPKNLSMTLSAEVAEIVEHFQWLTEEQSKNLPKDKSVNDSHLSPTPLILTVNEPINPTISVPRAKKS